ATYSESMLGKSNHYHDGHQLLYIVKGSVDVTVDGVCETAETGTLLLFSRFEEHSIAVRGDIYKRYSLRISPDIVNSHDNELLFGVLVNRAAGFCRALPLGEHAAFAESLFRRITLEYRERSLFREEMLDALLRELLIAICRLMPHRALPEMSDAARFVYRLQQRFESNFHENFSLGQLAEECHMSVSYLSHLFKETTGMSVMEYLHACRMLAAKKYLATTDRSVGEIVSLCGFSDDSNFSRNFRQKTGMTPTEFRRAYRT
ncbi:MAG: helix-turn-helix transcriptional regulator, partial [Clostridia bacterium]|nr:helix-turn-helix transcriptional regulator [Clostridia bacterium]